MKTVVQIKTADFEYISQEFNADMEAGKAVEAFLDLRRVWQERTQTKLTRKEWNDLVDGYLHGKSVLTSDFEKMNDTQKWMLHELDKAFSRIKPKHE